MANSSILSQCIQIHLLTTLVIWIPLIPKFLQFISNLVRKILRGDGTHLHIYQTYNQLIYPTMVFNFQGNKFWDKTSQFVGGNTPWVLEQISSQHCTTFTNGGYDTCIYYNTLIKLYLSIICGFGVE